MSKVAANRSWNVTVVDGTSRTGLLALNGSLNVVVATPGTPCGAYHSCGALNVIHAEAAYPIPRISPEGALYVQITPFAHPTMQKVTVISGSLGDAEVIETPDPPTDPEPEGEVPEWVPENAKIHIDLVRAFNELDAAYVDGVGVVAVDTLLGSDPNTENAVGLSYYDPTLLGPNGLAFGDNVLGNFPALVGLARTRMLAGATIVELMVGSGIGSFALGLTAADGEAIFVNSGGITGYQVGLKSSGGPLDILTTDAVNFLNDNTAVNCLAITIVSNRADIACNGVDAVTSAVDSSDRPEAHPFVACPISFGVGNSLQSITIHDPLPSTTGLSELSETGVTNTAPSITNADTTPELTEAETTNASTIVTVETSDAEGNPLTFTLPDDDGGNFAIDAAGVVTCTDDLLAGGSPYAFTVRATDPGGLFDEQEFTITVTA